MTVNNTKTIGFIGIGVMGKSMSTHLLNAGYTTHIYNRTKSKAEDLISSGAIWHDDVASLAQESDIIITIVGFPNDVEEVYLSDSGILNHAKAGSYVIDMTTSKPSLAVKIHELAKGKDIQSLDAPVSGGDIGAKSGELSIMCGGDKSTFDDLLPVLGLMGKNIVYQGPAGSGQHCKMCNQIVISGTMMGVCESMKYAKDSGLDPAVVLDSIENGAAKSWALSNLAPRMIQGDFDPGFYIKHFIKDMTIAVEESDAMGIRVDGLKLAKSLYEEIDSKGEGLLGTQALYKLLDESS